MAGLLIVFLRQMLQIKKLEKRPIDIFQDQHDSFVSEGLQLIEKRFKDLQPPVPPHGVTGESCPKSGTYLVCKMKVWEFLSGHLGKVIFFLESW